MLARPPLSVSLSGLDPAPDRPWGGPDRPRAMLRWAADLGVRWVQLDGTQPGLRARELDRSARRDLAATLRRSELACSGLDLWIPPEHFTAPSTVDRALAAATGAIELAADLARLTGGGAASVSMVVHAGAMPDLVDRLASVAAAVGVRIANHRLDAPAAEGPLGVGIDPAALLLAGQDPAAVTARAGTAIASARWSDASSVGRVVPGGPGGRLDETAYLVSLSAARYDRPLVLDLRGLADQDAAARRVVRRWGNSE